MGLLRRKKTVETNPTAFDYSVIVSPVITEKSAVMGSEGNVVAFKVATRASKTEIKGAVERIFKVSVSAVRTANALGKFKRTAKGMGQKPRSKKAYVTLAKGQTIDIVEGI